MFTPINGGVFLFSFKLLSMHNCSNTSHLTMDTVWNINVEQYENKHPHKKTKQPKYTKLIKDNLVDDINTKEQPFCDINLVTSLEESDELSPSVDDNPLNQGLLADDSFVEETRKSKWKKTFCRLKKWMTKIRGNAKEESNEEVFNVNQSGYLNFEDHMYSMEYRHCVELMNNK